MKAIIIGLVVAAILMIVGLLVIEASIIKSNKTANEPEEVAYNDTEVNIPTEEEIGDNPIATIKIEGIEEMQFVLFPEQAPQSVYNFIYLANSGFYDNLTMHRIETNFVAQGGDIAGTGAGPSDYTIKGEFPNNGVETGLTHQKGAIAWARKAGDNDSAGTQFYICLDDISKLDDEYAVFGYMLSGEEGLEQLQELSSTNGTPQKEVIIQSVSVDTKGVDYPDPDKLNEINTQ